MKQCERCGMKFKDVLAAMYHKANFQHKYVKMDPEQKARIVAAVEEKIGLHNFIVPPAVIRSEDIPATFCLIAEDVCVWEKYGMGMCGPCETRKEYLAKVKVAA